MGTAEACAAVESMLVPCALRLELLHVFSVKNQDRTPFDMAVLESIVSASKLQEDQRKRAEERKRRHNRLQPMRPTAFTPHGEARSQANPRYPKRLLVADERVPWEVEWPGYAAPYFVDESVLANSKSQSPGGWADDEVDLSTSSPAASSLRDELRQRKTFEADGRVQFDAFGYPRNPRGRTGLAGRGVFGQFGPNHAAGGGK